MSNHWTVISAECAMQQLQETLEKLANERMRDWLKRSRFKNGRIMFGMGSEYVELGGKQYNSWDAEHYPKLVPLFAAIDDVCEITDQYHLGCPDDLTF